jgi:kynurenine formamidase
VEWIDLSGELFDGQGGHLQTVIEDFRTHEQTESWFQPPCKGMAAKKLILCDHSGTHVDAPLHFVPGGKTIDQVDLGKFAGPGVLVDFSAQEGTGEELTLEAFRDWAEASSARPKPGDALIFRLKKDSGEGNVYVGLSEELASWIVDSRIGIVATDQGSIDWPKNKSRPAHRILLAAGIPVVEGLTNLNTLAGRAFTFLALPLKLRGATGSPVRAAALIS